MYQTSNEPSLEANGWVVVVGEAEEEDQIEIDGQENGTKSTQDTSSKKTCPIPCCTRNAKGGGRETQNAQPGKNNRPRKSSWIYNNIRRNIGARNPDNSSRKRSPQVNPMGLPSRWKVIWEIREQQQGRWTATTPLSSGGSQHTKKKPDATKRTDKAKSCRDCA